MSAEAVAAARMVERPCMACHVAHEGCPECGAPILWSRIRRRWMECEGIETRAHCCPVSGVVLRSNPLPSTAAPSVVATRAEWAWPDAPVLTDAERVKAALKARVEELQLLAAAQGVELPDVTQAKTVRDVKAWIAAAERAVEVPF